MIIGRNDNSRVRETKVAKILFVCIGIAILVAALFFLGSTDRINNFFETKQQTDMR